MAESKRPFRRTKGAVLIMVLTIMFVLIIMLVATLSVVSTAKQRTYSTFEENQATFTSRSAMEFFVNDLSVNDIDYTPSGMVDKYWVGKSATMTYAREIEMDIRTLKSLDTDGSTAPGWTPPAGGNYDLTEYGYNDDDTDALCYSDGSGSLPAPYDKYSSDTMLKYKVTLPTAESGSNKWGKFADKDQDVIITVEVLDRYFDLGEDPTAPGTYSVKYGKRTKDIVKLRVTATAVFNDYEATTVMIVDSDEPTVKNEFNKGICATGSATADTKIYAFGGMASNDNFTMTNNKLHDSFYSSKDLTIGSSGSINLGPDCYIATKGSIYFNQAMNFTAKTNNSFIYCGGSFNLPVSSTIGDDSVPLDILCTGGNLGSGTIVGNIYCDGDLTIDMATIYGDVYVTGTLFLGNTKISGDDAHGWTYQPGTPGASSTTGIGQRINGNVYAEHVVSSNSTLGLDASGVTLGCSDSVKLKYYPDSTITVLPENVGDRSSYLDASDADMCASRVVEDKNSRIISITLPTDNSIVTPSSTNIKKYRIPTFEYEYPAYFDVEDYVSGKQLGYKILDTVQAYEKYNKDTNSTVSDLKLYSPSDPAQMANVDKTTKTITSSGWLPARPNPTDPNSKYNDYVVSSGITLQLLDGATYCGKLIMEDDAAETIIIVPESTNVTIEMQILSAELNKILDSSKYPSYKDNKIYSGAQSDKTKLCTPPRINMYVGEGAIVNIDTIGSERGLINAYVYGPGAKFNVINNGLPNVNVNYNGVNEICHCVAVGAIVFKDVVAGSSVDSGVVYIDKDTEAEIDAGKSLLNWKSGYYSNDVNYEP